MLTVEEIIQKLNWATTGEVNARLDVMGEWQFDDASRTIRAHCLDNRSAERLVAFLKREQIPGDVVSNGQVLILESDFSEFTRALTYEMLSHDEPIVLRIAGEGIPELNQAEPVNGGWSVTRIRHLSMPTDFYVSAQLASDGHVRALADDMR